VIRILRDALDVARLQALENVPVRPATIKLDALILRLLRGALGPDL
jgi:hypothetical protein